MGQNLLQGLNELIYRSICCNAFEEYQIYRYIYGVHEVALSIYDLWLKLCCSLYRLYFYVMVKGNILIVFVFYSCKLSVAKELKTFERYLTWKTLKRDTYCYRRCLIICGNTFRVI